MVQLLIMYNMVFTARDTNEIFVGAICFGINSGAYVAEIIRAGIESIDRGQMEAGRSLGFNYIQTMRYIIVPQAVKKYSAGAWKRVYRIDQRDFCGRSNCGDRFNKSSAVHWFYRLHCIAAVVCSSRLLSCDRVRTYKIAEFIGKEVVTR